MRQLPLAVLSLVAVAAPLYAADTPKTWEGLEQRPVKGLDLVYVRPGAQLQGYKSILIDTPVEVAFDRHWDPNEGVRSTTRRMSASDIQAIKTEMAAEFHKVFAEELAKGGYALVDQVRDDTLRLHAQIADVFINAPDRMEPGRVTSYTMESGRATLEPELEDVLRVLGANRWDVLTKVGLPRSMPYFFGSLKVAITLAFVGTTVSEMQAANEGIGYLLVSAGSAMQMGLAFAGLVVVGAMAMAMYEFFSVLEKRITGWAHRGSQAH